MISVPKISRARPPERTRRFGEGRPSQRLSLEPAAMYASTTTRFPEYLRPRCAAALPLAALVLLLIASSSVQAGPPYISDDPESTDAGHWEIYHFGLGTRTFGVTAGQAGIDINGTVRTRISSSQPSSRLTSSKARLTASALAISNSRQNTGSCTRARLI